MPLTDSGYPEQLNTWDDVLYVVDHFPKEQWLPDLELLIDENNVKMWQWDHVLTDGEEGITDATHKVEEMSGMEGEEVQRVQYVLVWNEYATLFRMKFAHTEKEFLAAIKDVKTLIKTH